MRLKRNDAPEGHFAFTGAGAIRTDAMGHLRFVLVGQGETPTDTFAGVKVGEVLPDDVHYTLTAHDDRGRTWVAPFITPGVTRNPILKTFRVSGVVWEATARGHDHVRISASCDLVFFERMTIPATIGTRTTVFDGWHESESFDRNAAVVTTEDGRFLVRGESDRLVVRAAVMTPSLPPSFVFRVVESLQFALGFEIAPQLIHGYDAERAFCTIRSEPRRTQLSSILPPHRHEVIGAEQATWVVFERYLAHVLPDGRQGFHPLSLEWDRLVKSAGASLSAQLLITGISVESVLNTAWTGKSPFAPNKEERELLREWIQRINGFLDEAGCPDGLKARFGGGFGAMFQIRAVDKLEQLARKGLIDRTLIARWKELRNPSAHGSTSGLGDEAAIYARDAVITLLYQIVFAAIGYRGPFSDYSRPGWPSREYPFESAEPAEKVAGA